jgi:septal ring factor EnvC (AmiA/AmiB activator)
MASIIRWSRSSSSASIQMHADCTSDCLHHQVVAELEQREQRLYGLVESTVADEKETEHQIQSREARIEALEAALRARDRQLDALIAQSLERSGIALMGPAIGAAADVDALETALPRRSTRRSARAPAGAAR